MKNLLPPKILRAIQDRVIAGVSEAEMRFEDSHQDEDSLTGALGFAISSEDTYKSEEDEKIYEWKTYYRKIRGRGANAPEKKLGSDGIFQIEIRENGKTIFTKGLPFQAKKNWNVKDKKLVEQVQHTITNSGACVVVDFQKCGYSGCLGEDVIKYEGRKRDLKNKKLVNKLSETLGNQFLPCLIGIKGLYYDFDTENFITDKHLVGIDVDIKPKRKRTRIPRRVRRIT